ncbi:MAG: PTS sugar transporter subunit IIB [Gemmatimonadota bacterium]|nr:PTS sugar transporter subunit IIB [Gemmatimonadota bacterium]
MPVVLARIDDRLVHGQVVIGWGRPLAVDLIVLVDAEVAASDWEQEIYRMAIPEGMDILFADSAAAADRLPAWDASQSRVLLLTGTIETMAELHAAVPEVIRRVNLGGLHHHPGRSERLPYVYLSDGELDTLRELERTGAVISAQNLPGTAPVGLQELG